MTGVHNEVLKSIIRVGYSITWFGNDSSFAGKSRIFIGRSFE